MADTRPVNDTLYVKFKESPDVLVIPLCEVVNGIYGSENAPKVTLQVEDDKHLTFSKKQFTGYLEEHLEPWGTVMDYVIQPAETIPTAELKTFLKQKK